MAHGGARTGAGKPKGSVSKLDKVVREKALQSGLTPLDYLLGLLRDEGQNQDTRIDAAKAAAPYVHAKLANIDMKAKHEGNVTMMVVSGVVDADALAALNGG
jgi:hypothetical protein